jgi:hypothetical protein
MNSNHRAAFALTFLAIITFANTAFAQNMTANQTLLQAAVVNAQCKTNFTTSYIGEVTAAVPSLSAIGQYSTTLQADTSTLSLLAAAGNVTAFRGYLRGTYDPELNKIAKNVSASIRSANLTANVIAGLRQDYNVTIASYKSCNIDSSKVYALRKLNLFKDSIKEYQNRANDLASKGLNASALDIMIQDAQSQIVTPFATAIGQASNASQMQAALNAYCLFDGCKNGTNFHLAAHFSLQSLTTQLNYLETDKNVSTSSLAGAQGLLNNASSMLLIVGTKAYANGQANVIFGNLTAASKAMQQARKQDGFTKLKQNAERLVANYQGQITKDVAGLGKLPGGVDTSSLNATLSQAQTQVIGPLQAALNVSTNATQLYDAFKGHCLDNGCVNGTNFHLAAKLKIDETQAYLNYLEQKANASKYVMVNQTALSEARAYLNNASALVSSVGSSQFTQGQEARIVTDSGNFVSTLKGAFTVNKSKLTEVGNAVINRVKGTVKAGANAIANITRGNASESR